MFTEFLAFWHVIQKSDKLAVESAETLMSGIEFVRTHTLVA